MVVEEEGAHSLIHVPLLKPFSFWETEERKGKSLTSSFAQVRHALLSLFLAFLCIPMLPWRKKCLACNFTLLQLTRHHKSYFCVSQGGCKMFDFANDILYFHEFWIFLYSMLRLPWCSRLLSVIVFFKVSLCCWKLFPEKEESKEKQISNTVNIGTQIQCIFHFKGPYLSKL